MKDDPIRSIGEIYGQILARTTARYLTVRPHSIVVPDEGSHREIAVHILDHGAARTLYQDRKPRCRSLDAIRAIDDAKRLCSLCDERARCTPQIRIHLVFRAKPYRILLAYTSAKNFLFYATEIRHHGLELPNVVTTIRLLNRGTWGELRFARAPSAAGRVETRQDEGNTM
jgi:hypothetical protein